MKHPDYLIGDSLRTAREAAQDLGLSPITVRRAFREGRLSGERVGDERWSVIFVSRESIQEYREKHLGRRGRRKRGT